MSDDTIYLAPYDIKWPELAAREIAAVRAILPDIAFEIEHIGSRPRPELGGNWREVKSPRFSYS